MTPLFADGLHVHEVLVFGTFWFWVVLGLFFAAVTTLAECEKAFLAFLTFIACCAVLQMFGNTDILGYIWHHPFALGGWVTGYFAGGVGWSLVKWRSYCHSHREKYDDLKEDWLISKKVKGKTLPTSLFVEWEKYLKDASTNAYGKHFTNVPVRLGGLEMTLEEIKADEGPRFRNHKTRCLTWMTYWPCSFFWTMLNDPLRKLFKHAMSSLKNVYESIAKSSWQGVSKDFATPTTPPEADDTGRVPLGPMGGPLTNPPTNKTPNDEMQFSQVQ